MNSEHGAEIIKRIVDHLTADAGVVIISTYTKAWQFDKRHVSMFKVGDDGAPLMQRGRHWDDFGGAAIRFYNWKVK